MTASTRRTNRFDSARPLTAPFAGREQVLRQLCEGLKQGKSFQLFGQRAVGKSCALRRVVEKLAKVPALLPVHVELSRGAAHDQAVDEIIEATSAALEARLGTRIAPARRREAGRLAAEGRLKLALDELLHWTLTVRGPSRVALLLDAIHRVDATAASRLAATLYPVVERGEAQVVWTSRQPLRQELRNDVSPLASLFSQHIQLQPLTSTETHALVGIARQDGWSIERGFVQELHQMTNGHPYRLQYYLHAVLEGGHGATLEGLRAVHTHQTIAQLDHDLQEQALIDGLERTTDRLSVFVSYSHADEPQMQQLLKHLRVLDSADVAVTWVDNLLAPGTDWEQRILQAIERAHVAVLMISASFLQPGGFILERELPRILDRQNAGKLHVVPLLARACDWESHAWLAKMHLIHDKGLPVWRDSATAPDEALKNVARHVRKLVQS